MGKNLLLVDDSDIETLYFEGLIKKMDDVTISSVQSHEEAVSACEYEAFDLIFLDMYMPEGDAAGLLARIRKTQNSKGAKAIVLGSVADFDSEDYLQRNGFVNYLEKPVEYHMLRAALDMYC